MGELASLYAQERITYENPTDFEKCEGRSMERVAFQWMAVDLKYENRYMQYVYDDKLDTRHVQLKLSPIKKKFGVDN